MRSQNIAEIVIYDGCKRAGAHIEMTYDGVGALTEQGAKNALKMYYARCRASLTMARTVLG